MLKLKGGVVPALTTPFKEDSSLDLPGFRRLVEHVIEDGVHAILVNGCTGESWALEDDERAQVFKAAVEQARGRVPVVVGCGAMTIAQAKHKIHQAADAGCDSVMLQPPWYVMPNNEEVMEYYDALLAYSPLPAVIYNIPRRTGITLTVEMIDKLADHKNVCALKESSKDFLLLSKIIRKTRGRLNVFAGYANLLGLGAITEGAVGYMDSSTPVLGRKSINFFNAAISGDLPTARRLQEEMAQLDAGFFGTGTFPAGVKVALDMLGRPGGWVREPLKQLNAEQKAKVRAALVNAGLLSEQAAAAE